MKKFLICFVAFAALLVKAPAQAVQLPAASTSSVTIPIGDVSCTSTNTCVYGVYRLQGTCPGTLAGSTGWTLVGTTAVNATTYTDSSVQATTQYSYDVEASPSGSAGVYSGPSNCATITTPFHPGAATIGTLSAT